jgi:hypothetical protein
MNSLSTKLLEIHEHATAVMDDGVLNYLYATSTSLATLFKLLDVLDATHEGPLDLTQGTKQEYLNDWLMALSAEYQWKHRTQDETQQAGVLKTFMMMHLWFCARL